MLFSVIITAYSIVGLYFLHSHTSDKIKYNTSILSIQSLTPTSVPRTTHYMYPTHMSKHLPTPVPTYLVTHVSTPIPTYVIRYVSTHVVRYVPTHVPTNVVRYVPRHVFTSLSFVSRFNVVTRPLPNCLLWNHTVIESEASTLFIFSFSSFAVIIYILALCLVGYNIRYKNINETIKEKSKRKKRTV